MLFLETNNFAYITIISTDNCSNAINVEIYALDDISKVERVIYRPFFVKKYNHEIIDLKLNKSINGDLYWTMEVKFSFFILLYLLATIDNSYRLALIINTKFLEQQFYKKMVHMFEMRTKITEIHLQRIYYDIINFLS